MKLIIKNKVVSYEPIDDPVFFTHQLWTDPATNETSYFPEFPAAVVGCAEQVGPIVQASSIFGADFWKSQFCISKHQCTKLSYLPASLTESDLPGASDVQLAVLQLLVASSYFFTLAGSERLRASAQVKRGGYIDSLPNDQWIKEVIGWESAAWAALQVAVGDYFIGAKVRDPKAADSYARQAATEGEKKLCGMLKMRRSGGFV